MAWSAKVYLLSFLEECAGPEPVVKDFVRKQLLSQTQVDSIRNAIRDRLLGRSDAEDTSNLYSVWLSYSGLDFDNHFTISSLITGAVLQRALFDLTLGRRVKSFHLNRCSEVHEVRDGLKGLFTTWMDFILPAENPSRNIWWDESGCPPGSRTSWISPILEQHPDFVKILESWIQDSKHVQTVHDEMEEKMPTGARLGSLGQVFSGQSAKALAWFGEVTCLSSIL